ncbi:MAG: hypothetical protein R2796_07670 [Chitinophagaceae bacterium]|nr:hypothetical protein [Chitinophagaceae bacterium]
MRRIIAGHLKKDVIYASKDINYEISGKELIVKDTEFISFWNSGFINKFYKDKGILIDDYETTIIINDEDLCALKEAIEKSSSFKLKKRLLEVVIYALEKKSGMIFIL